MVIKAEQFKKRWGENLVIKEFVNQYGEKFEVYVPKGALTVYFAGDETGWEVENLFSSNFNVWSGEELTKLANAIEEAVKEAI